MKKFLNLKSILCCVAVVFGLIAVFMLFAPALVDKDGGETVLKGSEIAFGKKESYEGVSVKVLEASAYVLAFSLALVGTVTAVVALLGKGGKVAPLIAAVCFLGAAICYFLPIQLLNFYTGELTGDAKKDYVKYMRDSFKEGCNLGAGAIVGGVFGIVAALASVASVVCPIFLKSNSAE